MRRLLVVLALLAAALAGTARADTFVIVPEGAAPALPSADVAGLAGGLTVTWTTPPAVPQQLEYAQLVALWQHAGLAYGIPWQVLAAINKIESNFGRNMGPSSAGAIGWMQFMPSTWLRWGTDANGDGIADPWNAEDAIHSAARYLAAAGGTSDLYRGIYAYNHADWYVREVLEMAKLFGDAGVEVVFTLDRLQLALDGAQSRVARAGDALTLARKRLRTLERRSERLAGDAEGTTLLSERLDLEQRSAEVSLAARMARHEVVRATRTLAHTREALETARLQAQAPSFAPGTSALLSSPTYDGGYVFPVGGGASSVSVSHDHHDYPAADIAAPEGAPVYALASAVVESTVSDGRCGTGAIIRTGDGLEWVYCHLSYLDSAVQPGSVLASGGFIGLVGSTGHATGPHLHLQLAGAASWPQQQPWFEGFAGTAFRWQDAETPDAAPATLFSQAPGSAGVVLFTRS